MTDTFANHCSGRHPPIYSGVENGEPIIEIEPADLVDVMKS